ncbi:MAG TPA: MopE-related protein, partial [Chitinophagaceae bacterium]
IIVGASVPASHTRLFRLNAGGTTDISFGNAGEAVVEPLPGESISINDIAVQPDNKILLAGTRGSGLSSEFVLYKRSIDGQAEGRITADLGPDYNITNSIALQPDGKIVVVGYAGNDVAVARYNSDGSLDNSFDSDGKLLTSFGSSHARAIGNEVVLQPDGKIVVVGSLFPLANPGSPYLGAAIRYESNGQLDPCFGDDGKLVIDLPAGMDDLTSIAIQTDGKIVFGGHSSSISSGFDIVLARYIFPQAVTWYRDADLDGYGDDNNNIVSCTDPSTQEISCPQIIDPSCTLPIELCPLINDPNCTPSPAVKYVTTGGDCDDNNPEINPGAPEVCDGFDNNCNGETDEGINLQTWYLDYDGDGYGNDNTAVTTCVQPLSQVVKVDPFCIDLPPFFTCPTKIIHWVTTGGDCADAWPTTHPGATEVCDGFDNDCDGQIDEGLPTTTYYTDADGDGYGSGVGEAFCSNPGAGWASQAGDCDDSNASIHPVMGGDGKELCDGIDNDCDGLIDEGCSGKPTISISNATVYESEGLARVTIRLSHITTLQVKVNYKTEDGTAMSTKKDKDYKAIGNTTLTIPPGTLTITITVPVYNDGIVENNEYFYVVLSKPVNGILGNATGMVTILDGGEANITAKSSAGVSAQPSLEIESLDVTAFPNPSRDNFKIKITSPDQKERVLLKVYDVSGRLIETRTSISSNSIIQFGDKYRAGVYMIQVVQGEQHKELKLVKLN